jgi:hypothetical protein
VIDHPTSQWVAQQVVGAAEREGIRYLIRIEMAFMGAEVLLRLTSLGIEEGLAANAQSSVKSGGVARS